MGLSIVQFLVHEQTKLLLPWFFYNELAVKAPHPVIVSQIHCSTRVYTQRGGGGCGGLVFSDYDTTLI